MHRLVQQAVPLQPEPAPLQAQVWPAVWWEAAQQQQAALLQAPQQAALVELAAVAQAVGQPDQVQQVVVVTGPALGQGQAPAQPIAAQALVALVLALAPRAPPLDSQALGALAPGALALEALVLALAPGPLALEAQAPGAAVAHQARHPAQHPPQPHVRLGAGSGIGDCAGHAAACVPGHCNMWTCIPLHELPVLLHAAWSNKRGQAAAAWW